MSKFLKLYLFCINTKRLNLNFVIYFFCLSIVFIFYIKDFYSWVDISLIIGQNFVISYYRILSAILLFILNLKHLSKVNKSELIYGVISTVFIIFTIPSLVVSYITAYSIQILFYNQILFYFLYFISKLRIKYKKILNFNIKQLIFLISIIYGVIFILFLFKFYDIINIKNLILDEIYETRALYESRLNIIYGYLYSSAVKIGMILTVYNLGEKNIKTSIYFIITIIFYYLFSSFKTVLISLIVLLLANNINYKQFISLILKGFNILFYISAFLALFKNYYFLNLIFRRVQFMPCKLDICYFDFFSDNKLKWSNSTIGKLFFKYPYPLEPQNLIGEKYFNNPLTSANNGLISDGYMNFGFLGVVINILIFGFYFLILNNLKIESKYFFIFFILIFGFMSSPLSVTLMTHGGFVLFIISFLMLRKK